MTKMSKNSNQISLYTNLTEVQKLELGLQGLTYEQALSTQTCLDMVHYFSFKLDVCYFGWIF